MLPNPHDTAPSKQRPQALRLAGTPQVRGQSPRLADTATSKHAAPGTTQ